MKSFFLAVVLAVLTCCGSPAMPSAAGDSPDGGCCVLSIDNYLNWCSITENGVPFSSSETFDAGTVVNLEAAPLAGFVWGYWTGTDGATGGEDLHMSTTVTMNASKAVLACCPQMGQSDCSSGGGMPPNY